MRNVLDVSFVKVGLRGHARLAEVLQPSTDGNNVTAPCDRGSRTSVKRRRLRRLPGYKVTWARRINRGNDNPVKERPSFN